jgi:hypothetical protein
MSKKKQTEEGSIDELDQTEKADTRGPLEIIADLKKRFATRHSFSDSDVSAVQKDLSDLQSCFE